MFNNHSISQDPCESAIHSVIHVIRTNQWIRDFLFPPHPEHLSEELFQLSHAVHSPCIGLSELSMYVLPQTNNDIEPSEKRLHVIYAPLFTVDHFVAGFLIINRLQYADYLYKETPRYAPRGIRDLRTASFFSICDHPHGLTEVTLMRQISPGCRHESTAMLNTQLFRNILNVPVSNLPTMKLPSTANTSSNTTTTETTYSSNPCLALRSALIYSFYIVEMRKCPFCNADTFLSCSCAPQFIFKPGQSIFESELENWRTFAGTYEGEVSYRIYRQGGILQASECQAIASVQFLLNQDLTKELTTWAMFNAASKQQINIFKLCMPTIHVLGSVQEPQRDVESDALVKEFQNLYIMDTMRACARSYGVTKPIDIPTPDTCLQKLLPAPEGYTRTVVSKRQRSANSLSKAAARKIRNRESAQRSNERKSKHLKELKEGIRCVGEREKYLRSKIETLKRENREMKLQLSKKWASEIPTEKM